MAEELVARLVGGLAVDRPVVVLELAEVVADRLPVHREPVGPSAQIRLARVVQVRKRHLDDVGDIQADLVHPVIAAGHRASVVDRRQAGARRRDIGRPRVDHRDVHGVVEQRLDALFDAAADVLAHREVVDPDDRPVDGVVQEQRRDLSVLADRDEPHLVVRVLLEVLAPPVLVAVRRLGDADRELRRAQVVQRQLHRVRHRVDHALVEGGDEVVGDQVVHPALHEATRAAVGVRRADDQRVVQVAADALLQLDHDGVADLLKHRDRVAAHDDDLEPLAPAERDSGEVGVTVQPLGGGVAVGVGAGVARRAEDAVVADGADADRHGHADLRRARQERAGLRRRLVHGRATGKNEQGDDQQQQAAHAADSTGALRVAPGHLRTGRPRWRRRTGTRTSG